MRLAIMQPSYMPWIGYFDLFLQTDLFLVYDTVQFDKDGWRNRNQVKTPNGQQWITVPVLTKGLNKPTNKEIRINNAEPWRRKHLKTIEMAYKKAEYFDEVYPSLENIISREREFLLDLNMEAIRYFCDYLEIKTPARLCSELNIELPEDRNEKLIALCKHFGADGFYEPSGGKGYIDEALFESNGIRLTFQEYQHPVYTQLHGNFISHLSVIDLLMNCGKKSIKISNTSQRQEKEQQV